jgi:hypothetical protein
MANASSDKGTAQSRDNARQEQHQQDVVPPPGEQPGGAAAEGPATRGTLASGYSGRSSVNGTPGDVLKQRGSGSSPGADSRAGGYEVETDPLARDGVAAGASGIAEDNHGKPTGERTPEKDDDYADTPDGGAAVLGVSGTSGGGSGTGGSSR